MNHHVSKRNENIGKLSKKKGINSKSKNRIDQIKITRVWTVKSCEGKREKITEEKEYTPVS